MIAEDFAIQPNLLGSDNSLSSRLWRPARFRCERNIRDPREIERAVAAFARLASGGLVVTSSPLTVVYGDLIVALADRYKLPTIYWDSTAVSNGGLIAHGTDLSEQQRQAPVTSTASLKVRSRPTSRCALYMSAFDPKRTFPFRTFRWIPYLWAKA